MLVILKRSVLRKQQSIEIVRIADSQARSWSWRWRRSDAICPITSACIVAGIICVICIVVNDYWHIIADVST